MSKLTIVAGLLAGLLLTACGGGGGYTAPLRGPLLENPGGMTVYHFGTADLKGHALQVVSEGLFPARIDFPEAIEASEAYKIPQEEIDAVFANIGGGEGQISVRISIPSEGIGEEVGVVVPAPDGFYSWPEEEDRVFVILSAGEGLILTLEEAQAQFPPPQMIVGADPKITATGW
jgi:hypothetical protein